LQAVSSAFVLGLIAQPTKADDFEPMAALKGKDYGKSRMRYSTLAIPMLPLMSTRGTDVLATDQSFELAQRRM
jgi:hypothetical protein